MNIHQSGFLNLRNLPARLHAEQAGWFLGFATHDIPILIGRKLLVPLGKPTPNSVKYFSTVYVMELRGDVAWLSKATVAISAHWQARGKKREIPVGLAGLLAKE